MVDGADLCNCQSPGSPCVAWSRVAAAWKKHCVPLRRERLRPRSGKSRDAGWDSVMKVAYTMVRWKSREAQLSCAVTFFARHGTVGWKLKLRWPDSTFKK